MQGGDSRTSDLPAWLRPRTGGVVLEVHAQPGARRTAIVGEHGGRLKIAVNAPPLDGRANQALLALLSKSLALPLRALTLESGETGRDKRFFAATELEASEIARRLVAPQK
ncbi:MAG TPA: DUF167 family protein [Burkholderiaceae bacterium]|nr:DUF167 family protein [Burkholderiaceae bacterium]HQR76882.1 DUF167 family protein [Burkholderiaceae bacterium]